MTLTSSYPNDSCRILSTNTSAKSAHVFILSIFNVDFIGNYHAVEYNNFLFRGIVDSFVTTLFISVKFSQFGGHNRFIGGLV